MKLWWGEGKSAPDQGSCCLRQHQPTLERSTFEVKHSSSTPRNSCLIDESFDHPNLTAFGGANLFVDLLRHPLRLREHFEQLPFQKSIFATYTVADELETLVTAYALGCERIFHSDQLEYDPLLRLKLGLNKLPHRNTLYRALDRFDRESRVQALGDINRHVIAGLLAGQTYSILDIDTTVETVYGSQEGSCVSYNPKAHGRPSYQPLLAFEGQTRAAVHVELRSGHMPDAKAKVAFYRQAKERLAEHAPVRLVRADRGFTSEEFLTALEEDKVGYTLKVRITPGLAGRLALGVLWQRLPSHDTTEIEVGSIPFQAAGWSKRRRVVLVRTRLVDDAQPTLFEEYTWDYQAIVTDRDWPCEDVWHFYNQRCTCEILIKELKGGLGIDAISKEDFWPNAADLWIKTLAYNAFLHFKRHAPAPYRSFSIARLRRVFLAIPAMLVSHARRWRLRLPQSWPHQTAWRQLRHSLQSV